MENSAFALGRMAKIANEIHEIYCEVIRSGDHPPRHMGFAHFGSLSKYPRREYRMFHEKLGRYRSSLRSYFLNKGKKFEGEKSWIPGRFWNLDKFLESTMSQIENLPPKFSTEEEIYFVNGFYSNLKGESKDEK